jgi:hypothetical protein
MALTVEAILVLLVDSLSKETRIGRYFTDSWPPVMDQKIPPLETRKGLFQVADDASGIQECDFSGRNRDHSSQSRKNFGILVSK